MKHHAYSTAKTETSSTMHGSLTSYVIGFLLSLACTFGAFYASVFTHSAAVIGIIVAAILQLLVQLVFFLHFGRRGASKAHQLVFALTIFIVLILVGGTVWIMANLDRLHQQVPGMNELYQSGIVAPQNELK